jgi:predicted alpha/beta hydrolase family esterase
MPIEVLVIHGGTTFKNRSSYLEYLKNSPVEIDRMIHRPNWKENLQLELGNKYIVYNPKMPNSTFAKFSEWQLWYEKLLGATNAQILVGHSLGAIFLAKYYAINSLPNSIKKVILVAAPFKDDLPIEDLASFKLPNNLSKLTKAQNKLNFLFSEDDPIVPFKDYEMYKAYLPGAKYYIYKDMGHFNCERIPKLSSVIQ